MKFSKETAVQCKRAIATIKANELSTVKLLNEWVPKMVAHVHDGGNIAVCNDVLSVLKGKRRPEIARFMSAFTGHEFDKDKCRFGKKLANEKRVIANRADFQSFLESGQTVFGWLENQDKPATAADFDKVKFLAAFKKTATKGITHGVTANELIELLAVVAAEAQAKVA